MNVLKWHLTDGYRCGLYFEVNSVSEGLIIRDLGKVGTLWRYRHFPESDRREYKFFYCEPSVKDGSTPVPMIGEDYG